MGQTLYFAIKFSKLGLFRISWCKQFSLLNSSGKSVRQFFEYSLVLMGQLTLELSMPFGKCCIIQFQEQLNTSKILNPCASQKLFLKWEYCRAFGRFLFSGFTRVERLYHSGYLHLNLHLDHQIPMEQAACNIKALMRWVRVRQFKLRKSIVSTIRSLVGWSNILEKNRKWLLSFFSFPFHACRVLALPIQSNRVSRK